MYIYTYVYSDVIQYSYSCQQWGIICSVIDIDSTTIFRDANVQSLAQFITIGDRIGRLDGIIVIYVHINCCRES
jgi:hypothetical protein